MGRDDTKQTGDTQPTRRKTLKSIGASVAAAFGSVPIVGRVVADNTTEITVVRMKNNDVKKQVPADWWEHESRAKAGEQELNAKYESHPAVDGVGISRSSSKISGRYTSVIKVYFDSTLPNSKRPKLSSTINGVSIVQTETELAEPNACYTGNYDPVPGGVQASDESGGKRSVVSVTCAAERSGTRYLMTSLHLWGCGATPGGEPLYQSGQYFGDVYSYNQNGDWAIVSNDGNLSLSDSVVDQYGTLAGHVTYNGLIDLQGSNETVYKVGRTTCKTSGNVTDAKKTLRNCHNSSSKYYYDVNTKHSSGDSGAPNYRTFTYNNNKYLALIGPHYGGHPPSGIAAYRLNNYYDLNFDFTNF